MCIFKESAMDINKMIGFSHSLMQIAFVSIPKHDLIHGRAAEFSHRAAVALGSIAFARCPYTAPRAPLSICQRF